MPAEVGTPTASFQCVGLEFAAEARTTNDTSLLRRAKNQQTWRRLTLRDLLLVHPAFVLSFSLASSLGPVEVGGVERAMAGRVWGLVFAGPIVLAT